MAEVEEVVAILIQHHRKFLDLHPYKAAAEEVVKLAEQAELVRPETQRTMAEVLVRKWMVDVAQKKVPEPVEAVRMLVSVVETKVQGAVGRPRMFVAGRKVQPSVRKWSMSLLLT